jgi:hypothetical protein
MRNLVKRKETHPMIRTFNCKKCGEYFVPEEAFDKLAPPEFQRRVAFAGTISGVRIDFMDGCPKCKPEYVPKNKDDIKFVILRKKRSKNHNPQSVPTA